MNEDETYAAQAEAAKRVAGFIDIFDAPGVTDGAERLFEAAREYGDALTDAGLSTSDAIRATIGTVLGALLP